MYMPQYLAAFVTPRHPILEKVIMRASAILKRWTGNGSLTAYLHDVPNRPKQIMGAIYEAIKEEHKINGNVPIYLIMRTKKK